MKVYIALTVLFALLAGTEATPAAEELTCYTSDGSDYRGNVSTTASGRTCQSWSDIDYPDEGLDNYCRNPDGEKMPWCYTTDPEKPWEFCSHIPRCDVSCYTCDGRDFRGKVASTISGKTCQSWSAQTPHKHKNTPEIHPDKGLEYLLESTNYCRNPDGGKMPWCYTTDPEKRWEYCQVPACHVAPEPICYTCDGRSYRGEVAFTASMRTCQSWSAQTPHKHDRTPENHPDKGLDSNNCRNPDGEKMPWCYTTDPEKRWEFCSHIPKCFVAPDYDDYDYKRQVQQSWDQGI